MTCHVREGGDCRCYKTYEPPPRSSTSNSTILEPPLRICVWVSNDTSATPRRRISRPTQRVRKSLSLSFSSTLLLQRMAAVKATLVTVLLMTIGAILARDIPEFLHICNTRDPQLNECVLNSIETLKPHLKTGEPEYNIPSLEPLKLKKLALSPTNSIRMQANDITVTGASNFNVRKVGADFQRQLYIVDVELPNILVEGKYNVNGRVLLLPIHGSGAMHGNFSNCSGAVKIQGEKYFDEHNVEKIRIIDFKLKVSVGKGMLKLDNLFGGQQTLGNIINQTINSNFDLFLKELLPVVEKALSDAFQNIADNIVQQFSFAQLFPNA